MDTWGQAGMKHRYIIGVVIILACAFAGGHFITAEDPGQGMMDRSAPMPPDPVSKGAYLAGIAACERCHTAEGAEAAPFAGGLAIATGFGAIYTPNITPDVDTGIGGWTERDFLNAMKRGISPDGGHYFPAFPYTSYRRMTDSDVLAIWAWLSSQEAVTQVSREDDILPPFSWRYLQRYWKWLYLASGWTDEEGAPEPDPSWLRGRYLVEGPGHCGECHTPRSVLGGLLPDQAMTGSRSSGALAPNITFHADDGIGDWSEASLAYLLKTGFKPDFDDVQGEMAEIIKSGTSHLTEEDISAIIGYLKSLPELPAATK